MRGRGGAWARGAYALAALVLGLALALVFADRVPFWRSMTLLMGLVALGTGLLLRRAGEPVFKPSLPDTALGLAGAFVSYGLASAVLALTEARFPALGSGLALLAGYVEREPRAWAWAGIVLVSVGEELFWRHYLPFVLAGRSGLHRAWAQLLCVLPYAAFHLFSGNVFLALPALAFGTAWGLTTAWRGGPWAAIVWHVSFDALLFLAFPPR